jgi:hypothetical protein
MKVTFGVTDDDLAVLGAFYGEILSLSDADIHALDKIGAYAWMQRFNLATPLVSQICMNLNTLFVVAVDKLPASEMIFALRDQVLGGAGRYHIGGYGHVAEVCGVCGGTGRLVPDQTRVQKILVEEGRAVGVQIDGRDIRARAVISNAGIQPTILKLVGAEHFPRSMSHASPHWSRAGQSAASAMCSTSVFSMQR